MSKEKARAGEGGEGKEVDPVEEDKQHRAAIAPRAVRLGGARVGAAPAAGSGRKVEAPKEKLKPAVEEAERAYAASPPAKALESRHHSSLPNATLQQDAEQPRQSRQGGTAGAAPFFSNAALNMSAGGGPNAAPAPPKHQQDRDRRDESDPSHRQRSATMPTPGESSRESNMRELREFWKQYMRAPFSGPRSGPLAGVVTSPGLRRAPLPSAKALAGEQGLFLMGGGKRGYNNHHDQHNGRERAAGAEDLWSHEAAVVARKAAAALSLGPRVRGWGVQVLGRVPKQMGGATSRGKPRRR